jgi:hypothetical protein
MDVMFWGVVHPTLAALPLMRERGGGKVLVIPRARAGHRLRVGQAA